MERIRERFIISIFSSFFLAFTFLGFGTLELYMSNREEFWFTYSNMLPVILFLIVLVVVICSTTLMVLPCKFFKYGIALINGFTLVLYIQGNFLPNDYGVLDGNVIEWGNYHGRLVYNSIIWCIVILGAVFFAKKNEKMYFFISKVVTGIILATQIVTLIIVGLTLPKSDDDSILSAKGQFEISNNNNTIVFVLDCFDSEVLCELLQEYPSDMQEMFDNFTFYHNVVGGATRTKYAIPYIFTGQTNADGNTYTEYIRNGFEESPLVKELQTGKYDARVYTMPSYIDMQQVKTFNNVANDIIAPTSEWGLTTDFLKVTAFRYAPHAIKKFFWIYSGDFDYWKENNVSYAFDDVAFYEKLKAENLNCSINKDVFRFYHLMGAHPPYTMNEKCERIDSDSGSELSQALGSLRIVSEFIEQLKKSEAYENSSIFVIADHGARNYEQNPLFMVKLRGTQQEFQQSEVPLSYKNFPDMLAVALKGQKLDIEKDYICSGERYFYVGYEANYRYTITEYVSEGMAYDAESFHKTGHIYATNSNDSYKYQIGQELSFAEDATANIYCKTGFYTNETTHTWTGDGDYSEMYFELEGNYDNLLLELEHDTFTPPKRVGVYANEKKVADYIANGHEKKQIVIPKEYIEDSVLDLKFDLPDSVSPAELGMGDDARKFSLYMSTIKLESTDKEFDLSSQMAGCYEMGTALVFSNAENTAKDYCVSGFSEAEEKFTWTDSNTAVMRFMIPDEEMGDMVLEYTCEPFNGEQHVIVYANDQKILDDTITGEETKKATISAEYIQNGELNLRFELPDAISPKTLGVSEDGRTLGLAMKELTISALK